MFEELIIKKAKSLELTQAEFYEVIDYMLKNGANNNVIKFFLGLDSFGMTKREVLYLTMALRDSGKVLKYNQMIFEKHSTGGIGDGTSIVLIPLLASLGYKIIKTTGKSLVYTNGSTDRFASIPHFRVKLSDQEIQHVLEKTNACVLSHKGDMCPADRLLYDVIENYGLESNLNFLAASIACKKLASGAKLVLVDVKYGEASVVKKYSQAKKLAHLLRYIFNKNNVKSVIVITNTLQTIGEGIGNAIEVADALNVLQGKHTLLRDISIRYTVEMITKADPRINRKDANELVASYLDNGNAYNEFMEIVHYQGGDEKVLKEAKLFTPYKSVNFVSDIDGCVGFINSLVLGELVRRLCAESHDNNIGFVLRVKIGDFVKKGDIILSFYYKNDEDLEKYKNVIMGCVRMTKEKIKRVNPIKKVYR